MAHSKPRHSAPTSRPPHRPKRRSRPWYQGPTPIIATGAVIAAIVIVLVLLSRSGSPPSPAPAASAAAAIVDGVTHLDPASSLGVGAGALKDPLKPTGASATRAPDGRIPVTYIGAEYCPYCAAERWSLLVALSRFGTFSGVELTQSSSTDIYPNTPTFTLAHASFTSISVDFVAFETADRNGQSLQQPSTDAQAALTKYDTAGSIPFVDIANLEYAVGSGYLPDVLTGQDWQQIVAQLSNSQFPVAQQVIGNANWLTAGMCRAGAKSAACADSHIQALVTQLGS